ncbi:MAG: hypothetical protein LBD91_02325 [Prevotellaceae bacterium]|jgi:hypothetical protein|nr:hypothetical protein [Prevotellaceae bacterium]
METNEGIKESGKHFIIANPIYDTVFKQLMENQQVAKFFINTIIKKPIDDLSVIPQEFFSKRNKSKSLDKDKNKSKIKEIAPHCSMFRLDFMATIRDADGTPLKILIELWKSWGTEDILRSRRYLRNRNVRVGVIDGKEITLPVISIYILGHNLAGIISPCFKVGRTYIDMIYNKSFRKKSKFTETLTHNSYVIQVGRIANVRYTTNLNKLLNIFEQKHFIMENSDVMKAYPYQTDDKNINLITDILYEIGVDPKKRKEIEDEKELLHIANLQHNLSMKKLEEKEKTLEEKENKLKEKKNKLEEKKKKFKEKKNKLEEKKNKLRETKKKLRETKKKLKVLQKKLFETKKKLKEEKTTLEENQKTLKKDKKAIAKKDKRIAELERLLRNKSEK